MIPDRQKGVLDSRTLQSKKIVQIGVGRGFGFAKLMASSGVSRFCLIDPQEVALENVGLSAYETSDVGFSKVAAAARHIHAVNPLAEVETLHCDARDLTDLANRFAAADLIKIGVDDPPVQFEFADLAQTVSTDAMVCGMTGDGSQWFAAGIFPQGPTLRELLPEAWREIKAGARPPAFFPSCRINAETMNVNTTRLGLGLLHYRAGSPLPSAEIGEAFVQSPLAIGSNGFHAPSGFLMPARLLNASPPRTSGQAD
nr:ThiF family adenylyltransferase [Jiella sp. LLJ827]